MNQIYSGKVEDVSHFDKGISKGAKQIEQFFER